MKLKNILLLTFGFIVFNFVWIYIITKPAFIDGYNFSDTGQLGDTIGGLTAPLIGVLGSILVYISFQEQYKANKIQIRALQEERIRNEAERWYSVNLDRLNDIKKSVLTLKFISPIGQNKAEIKFDNVIEFEGFFAIYIITEKLKVYSSQDIYQRLSIDFYIFELGYYLKQLQQLGFDISLDEKFPEEKKIIASNITAFYNGYIKSNILRIINSLNDSNDPKDIKAELVKTVNFIESMIDSEFLS